MLTLPEDLVILAVGAKPRGGPNNGKLPWKLIYGVRGAMLVALTPHHAVQAATGEAVHAAIHASVQAAVHAAVSGASDASSHHHSGGGGDSSSSHHH
jgi:hypothetical protein